MYFKEGDQCPFVIPIGDSGHIVGTLFCGVEMRDPLDATNCETMKTDPSYPTDPSGCAGN